jgi:hypothetical protein
VILQGQVILVVLPIPVVLWGQAVLPLLVVLWGHQKVLSVLPVPVVQRCSS